MSVPASAPESPHASGSARAAGELLRRLAPHPLAGQLGTGAALVRARHAVPAPERWPSGLPALDRLLGGGLLPGELVEWVGRRSSGRWAALLSLLAAVTARGEGAVLVDGGDALEPADARAAGVALPRLLWARCATLREALAATGIALAGGWPLVALDLGDGPLPAAATGEATWQRLARAARSAGTTLVVSSPRRVTGAAAAAVLRSEGRGARWLAPPLLAGLRGELILERSRRGERERDGARERLRLTVPLEGALESASRVADDPPEGARRVANHGEESLPALRAAAS